ncbi:HAD-IIIA family hydrolase [Methylomonas paludis]|uniref:HAD-IIIA family hydrolase n=1 Tax=Methylomonas paludis TaxID=1173101 RepID=A0A975RAD3_9GAMM|nr:HAD-IIIA family hydrolase [Methylomonas paludis]QWF71106.1 HAD-IIIA family hydrolase [Methylomonas paludis]
MKNRFDLIIFDWDGTLMDSVDWIVHCIQQAAEQYDCPVPPTQAAKDIIGLSIENAIAALFPDVDETKRQLIVKQYSRTFSSRLISRADLFPGVYEMLQQLRESGYRLAVATGKKSTGLQQVMQACQVSDLFCTTRSSDQTASKPDPLMLNEIVTELGIDKQRTLMIGDSIHDLQMALNAGIAAVGVTCGAHSADILEQYQPLFCLDYPTDLLELFNEA